MDWPRETPLSEETHTVVPCCSLALAGGPVEREVIICVSQKDSDDHHGDISSLRAGSGVMELATKHIALIAIRLLLRESVLETKFAL